MKPISLAVVAGLLCAVGAAPSLAADTTDFQQPAASPFDIAFGVGLTTNYISRGSTQSNDEPAIDGYMEATYGIAYAGVWASRVNIAPDSVEVDVYGGIRPEFGQLSLDLGYARYIYDSSGDCCGEFYAKPSFAVTDAFSVGTEVYWDPELDTNWAAANAEFSGLPYEITVSGSVGTDFGTLALGSDKVAWDAGVSRSFLDDTVTLDLRYYDSNMDPARVAARLAFDSSFSALMKN